MIRVLVADDQPMARERLVSLIKAEPDIELAGTATSGPEAVDCIRHGSPDLVFLDMQMPGLDGFQVIQAIGLHRMPATVFVTAYDEYAVRAFDVQAVDYLLKPFGRQRFQAALSRARQQLDRGGEDNMAARLAELIRMGRPPDGSDNDRLCVKSGGRVHLVDVFQIDWVEAQGNNVHIHVGGDVHVMRETMTGIMQRLGSTYFTRIHRSRIVNTRRVKELLIGRDGAHHLVLWTGQRIGLSRTYRAAAQEHLAAR